MAYTRWWRVVWQLLDGATPRRRRPGIEILEARLAPAITLSISNPVPFPKPDTGDLFGVFVVTRSGDLAPDVLVDYTTQDGTGPNGAHAGIDYDATSGTLHFLANQITATIDVRINGNNVFQADKTFTVSLSHPVPGAVFAPPQSFATGLQPRSVAVGDFNGDGKPDLVIANTGTPQNPGSTVSVLLNTTPAGATAPSFAPQQTFATGSYPASVAVGDVNGDGNPDLVIANDVFDGTVSILLNTTLRGATTPSFAAQQTFAVGNDPSSVAVGDFNGDGKPDLAVANYESNTVSVLLNTTPGGASAPSFAAQQSFAAGTGPRFLAVADFNGDGKPDLAVASASFVDADRLSVLLNTTPAGATVPGFAPQQTFYGTRTVSLVAGDFNGDGKPDLAFAGGARVAVLLNTTPAGASTVSFVPERDFGTNLRIGSVGVGDFNGDGKLDLAVVTNLNTGAVSVLLNSMPLGATTPSFALQPSFPTNSQYPVSAVAADFTGDGKPDLAVANSRAASVTVLLNETPPMSLAAAFTTQQTFPTGGGPDWVAVGDFNGDGKLDLAIASEFSNTVAILLNTTPVGATAPTFGPRQTFATGRYPASVALGDFNGDGKLDLAVANFKANTVSVLLNTTPAGATVATFTPQQTFPVGSVPYSVAVGDVNGDGKPDLVVANDGSGNVSVLLNTTPVGSTTPSFTVQRTFAVAGKAPAVAVGDVNGDGKPDVVVADDYGNFADGRVSVLLNTTPAGATVPSFATPQTFATGSRPFAVALGDFNGDGKPDLAVPNYHSNTVSVLLNMTPAGATIPAFAPQQTFATGVESSAAAVGDFNGDGKPDLAVPNWGLGTVSVLADTTVAGATTPSFAPAQVFTTGTRPSSVASADFNGDGKPDLAIPNFGDNTVSVFLNGLPITFDENPATGTISSAAAAPMTVDAGLGTTPQSATVNTAFSVPLAVDVRNAAGHLVQGVGVTFTAPGSGASGSFGGNNSVTVVTNASGRATAPAFLANTVAGSYMVTAQAAGGSNPSASFSLTNTPAAASSLTLTDLPITLVAGTPTTLTVSARDPFGNLATDYTGTVHFLSSDPNALLPADYTFTAADHGAHTFAGLILPTAGIRFVLAYDTADHRIVGASPGVTVVTAAADHFAVTTSAADPEVAGTPFDVTVTAQDAYGNTVITYTGMVTFSSQDPYGASLPPDYTFRPTDQGQVTFSGGATLYTASTWDVTATDITSGITGSAFVNVMAAPAVALQVVAPPGAASGAAFDVTVIAVDPYGNTDTNYQGTVTSSTTDPDPGVVLPPDYTFQPADQGMVTFPGGVTLITPGDQTLTVTDTDSGITGSAIVTVSGPSPGAPVRLRPPRVVRWLTTGWPATVNAEAFHGLFVALERRRSDGRIGDALAGALLD